MNVEEAATSLGRNKEAMQHVIARGTLPTVRSNGCVFLDREDLDQGIEQSKIR
jgi:hypothetical protein